MKKSLFFLLLSLFVLGACGKSEPATKTGESSKKVTTVSDTKPTEPVTETYAYSQQVKGISQNIQETITYQGDRYQGLRLHTDQVFDDAVRKELEGKDFETVKAQLLSNMENQPFIKSLKAAKGVEVVVDVTQDYHIILDVKIDMQATNLEELSTIEGLGVDFKMFETIKPVDYIAKLKAKGATLVSP